MTGLSYPSLYQVNTRVWLTELSPALGKRATLDDISGDRTRARTRPDRKETGGRRRLGQNLGVNIEKRKSISLLGHLLTRQ